MDCAAGPRLLAPIPGPQSPLLGWLKGSLRPRSRNEHRTPTTSNVPPTLLRRFESPLAWNQCRNLGKGVTRVSLLWIILIVVLVLLLLGFFSRGRW